MLADESLLDSVQSIKTKDSLKVESGNVLNDESTINKAILFREAQPSMYKIDEWKNYRNQIGLTRIRHENQLKHARNQSMGIATDRSQFVRAGLRQVGGDLTEESSLNRLSTTEREQITQAIYSLMTESQNKEINNTSRQQKLGEQKSLTRQH